MAVRLVPSVETLVVARLKASADIAAIAGTRVGTELYVGADPVIWLSFVTGEERFRNHLAADLVDVRSYGGTKAQADLLARTAHAVLLTQLVGAWDQGVISSVGCTARPSWNPDEGFSTARPRYVGTYQIVHHPLPA